MKLNLWLLHTNRNTNLFQIKGLFPSINIMQKFQRIFIDINVNADLNKNKT